MGKGETGMGLYVLGVLYGAQFTLFVLFVLFIVFLYIAFSWIF